MEAIRRRLKQRLAEKGWSARHLGIEAGHDEKNVQRYVSGEVETIPASLLGACEVIGFASARWLATGEGSPVPTDASQAEALLAEIRQLLREPVTPSTATSDERSGPAAVAGTKRAAKKSEDHSAPEVKSSGQARRRS